MKAHSSSSSVSSEKLPRVRIHEQGEPIVFTHYPHAVRDRLNEPESILPGWGGRKTETW